MKVIYNENFTIDLGLLNYLHPFDGKKFQKTHEALVSAGGVDFISPSAPINNDAIDGFLTTVMQHRVQSKNGVLQALEVPSIPFLSYAYLDKKVLDPMRWAVAGTLLGAERALTDGEVYWNLSGGYHHAAPHAMEGFCIYNDIGICIQQLLQRGLLTTTDRILIIDTDAHHGNGNAHTFMEWENVVLLDIYNASIYPVNDYTRERVNIPMKLKPGTDGETYLRCLQMALAEITGNFTLAFVVAGTDVLAEDKLGGLKLSVNDVAARERITLAKLREMKLPGVVLGGGGYSSQSHKAVTGAILECLVELR
jgi:histone deacetylase 11